MFEGRNVKVILANGGTGKTTYIVNDIMKELRTRRPEEIAFVTFTRKGAEEGLRRVCTKLMFEPNDLPYFRTLHSLTFHAMNYKADQMFGRIDQRKFNKQYGYNVNRVEVDVGRAIPTKDTKYLDYYDLERSNALTSRQLASSDIEIGYYRRLVQNYEEYKNQQHLVDFFDCLIKYVEGGDSLPCKVVYVDECQDITALQWKVIEKAFPCAEKIIMVGDDKQSLYTYSGARPDILIDFSKRFPVEHLSKSYRLPKKIYELSLAVTDFIGDKTEQKAEFKEGNPEGMIKGLNSIDRLANFIDVDRIENNKTSTEWYILSRNNCYLEDAKTFLEDNLIPYWTADGFFMGGEIMARLKDFLGFRMEGYKNEKKREEFQRKFGITDFNVPFTDTNIFTEGRKWVYASYIEKYGLETLKDMCKWNPQVLVATVHHVKGGECRNCAFMLDTTRRSQGNVFNDLDEELRILYVAVTRAKENLFLIDSKNGLGYDSIFDTIKKQYKLEW